MPSARAGIIARVVAHDRASSPLRDVGALHARLAQGVPARRFRPPAPLRRAVRVSRGSVAGRPCHRLAPRVDAGAGRHVVYFHGGGFVNDITLWHWLFLTRLVRAAGCTVTVPMYELVPRVRAHEAVGAALSILRVLAPEHPVLMGDSAGAGLALATAQAARDGSVPTAGEVVLLSPWVDVTMRNPEIAAVAPHDPMLSAAALAEAGRVYAGDDDPGRPPASPLHGDLAGLGRLTILTSTRDILHPDARRLRDLAGAAPGTTVAWVEEPGVVHDWMLLPMPEAGTALAGLARLLSRPAARP